MLETINNIVANISVIVGILEKLTSYVLKGGVMDVISIILFYLIGSVILIVSLNRDKV